MSESNEKRTIFDEIASEDSDVLFYSHRKATFKKWCFDKTGSPCSSDALARAGFVYSGTRNEPATATCAFCFKEMIFEEQDDPWEEHQSHTRNCAFIELNKLDEKTWTVRDFITLLAGRLAAMTRKKVVCEANNFYNASQEIVQMAEKAMGVRK